MILWLLRLVFPIAGWYVYYAYHFDPAERYGPFDTSNRAKSAADTESEYFCWVRFSLW